MCLVHMVTCLCASHVVVVVLCTSLCSTVKSTVVQYLYFKLRMSKTSIKAAVIKKKKKQQWCSWYKEASAIVLYYCTFQDTVRVKMFYFFSLFLCVICVESIINLLRYSAIKHIADCVSWVSRLTFFVCYVISHFSRVRLFATLWTVAHQAPLSMGMLQARILEWVAMLSSRGSSQPRYRTHASYVSCTGRRVLYH